MTTDFPQRVLAEGVRRAATFDVSYLKSMLDEGFTTSGGMHESSDQLETYEIRVQQVIDVAPRGFCYEVVVSVSSPCANGVSDAYLYVPIQLSRLG